MERAVASTHEGLPFAMPSASVFIEREFTSFYIHVFLILKTKKQKSTKVAIMAEPTLP